MTKVPVVCGGSAGFDPKRYAKVMFGLIAAPFFLEYGCNPEGEMSSEKTLIVQIVLISLPGNATRR